MTSEPDFARLCKPCFIASKKAELAELQDEVQLLRAELAASRSKQAPPIDLPMIRWLLQQAHPDRHNDSKTANLATQWLLSLKAQHEVRA